MMPNATATYFTTCVTLAGSLTGAANTNCTAVLNFLSNDFILSQFCESAYLRICSLFLNIHLFILDQEIHLSAHIPEAIDQGFQFVQCLAAFASFALSRECTDRSDTALQLTCGIIGGMDED